jgi:hypothetical protein
MYSKHVKTDYDMKTYLKPVFTNFTKDCIKIILYQISVAIC